jgi:2-polyprenyl-6-methoxyphenol hydroxylase-like FAD-dependent oxidoreductase
VEITPISTLEQTPLDKATLHGMQVDCCIVGGGPSGLMAGLLLARAGVSVVVLEKHRDFLRDFRGDTVHPSTLEVMWEIGLLGGLLKRPHQELKELTGEIFGRRVRLADFSKLKTHAPFVALMPQCDFLEFIAQEAQSLPTFRLIMGCEVTELVSEGGRVLGVKATVPGGSRQVRARVTIAADGRSSTLRELAGLRLHDYGASIDVLWFRLSRKPRDGRQALGNVGRGRVLVLLDRGEYWQCAFVIPKGTSKNYEREGIGALRAKLRDILPLPGDRLKELESWDQIKLLTVRVNRLRKWARPGLLCIGDAAHAMSPIGGIGINLAIQDAVAAARAITPALRAGHTPTLAELKRVQRRRGLATRLTIGLQLVVQNRLLGKAVHQSSDRVPALMLLLNRSARLRCLLARIIGLGLRPEHVPPLAAEVHGST